MSKTDYNYDENCPKCGRQMASTTHDDGSYLVWCLNGDYDAFFDAEGYELETEKPC